MRVQTVLWRATWIAVGLVLAGLVVATVDAAIYGGWYLAREPWIGAALSIIVIGLLVTDIAGAAWVLLAAPWWAKLLVILPAGVAAFWWFVVLTVGLPTTGRGGPAQDVRTIIYSAPDLALMFVGLPTLAIVSIALVVRLRSRSGSRTSTT